MSASELDIDLLDFQRDSNSFKIRQINKVDKQTLLPNHFPEGAEQLINECLWSMVAKMLQPQVFIHFLSV